jgi:hypothetical protein
LTLVVLRFTFEARGYFTKGEVDEMRLIIMNLTKGCWKMTGFDGKFFDVIFFTEEDPTGKTKVEIEEEYLQLWRDVNAREALRLLHQKNIPKTKRIQKKRLIEILKNLLSQYD